ncbi:MAG: MarR family transcriptional regulator [Pseudomonadota bacterium]
MRFLRKGLAELNLSPARFQILKALNHGGALSMVELAGLLSVTKRNITTLVDGLEKDDLAARRPHPTDRRSTLVELTATGHAVFAQAAKAQRAHLERLLATLDPKQQKDMAQALTRLTQAMTTGSQMSAPGPEGRE